MSYGLLQLLSQLIKIKNGCREVQSVIVVNCLPLWSALSYWKVSNHCIDHLLYSDIVLGLNRLSFVWKVIGLPDYVVFLFFLVCVAWMLLFLVLLCPSRLKLNYSLCYVSKSVLSHFFSIYVGEQRFQNIISSISSSYHLLVSFYSFTNKKFYLV